MTMTVVWPKRVDGVAHELEDLGARGRVEVAGRLVGEQDGRTRRERPGDGDALLLAAGELAGRCLSRSARPTLARSSSMPLGVGLGGRRSRAAAGRSPRAVSIGRRLKNWKMKPMWLRLRARQAVVVGSGDVGARRSTRPASGGRGPASRCMSVDLPEPDGPITAVSCAAGDLEVDAAKRVHRRVAAAVVPFEPARADRRLRGGEDVVAFGNGDGGHCAESLRRRAGDHPGGPLNRGPAPTARLREC